MARGALAADGAAESIRRLGSGSRWRLLGAVLLVACGSPTPQNLLFVSLDTTRQDHLSTYGYPRPTAPNLDRLAQDGALFHNAIAQWTATNPSHISMFTGLYPHTHGVGTNTAQLPDDRPTLAEILQQAGFRTGAFVSGYTMRPKGTGLDRGFETYDGEFDSTRRDGRETAALALHWLASLRLDERWFLFLHLYDAHGPYRGDGRFLHLFLSPERGPWLKFIPQYQERRDEQGNTLRHLNDYVDRYDAEIRYQDEVLGDVLAAVDLQKTVVLVVADHGETLAERQRNFNLSHATGVFEEQIRIPFVLHAPGLDPGRFAEIVETVDILPTVLDLLQVPMPEGLEVQGESLAPLLRKQRRERTDSLAFSAIWARKGLDEHLDKERSISTVRSRRWKLVVYPGLEEDFIQLYDLREDPEERRDVADGHPGIRDRLLARWAAWEADRGEPVAEQELTPEDVENLRALGYID